MGKLENWSFIDSVYYAFITAVTLGYGDLSPTTRNGRLFGILFVPLAVASIGELLGTIASTQLERRQELYYKSFLNEQQQYFNLQRLLDMDTDRNGKVSKQEYIQFMLKEMDLVSDEQLDALNLQFQRLDKDRSGYLDQKDLQMRLNRIQKHQQSG